jgi:hypothetical protein
VKNDTKKRKKSGSFGDFGIDVNVKKNVAKNERKKKS